MHGVSDATIYKWRSAFGGMEVSDAKSLKAPVNRPGSAGDRQVTQG